MSGVYAPSNQNRKKVFVASHLPPTSFVGDADFMYRGVLHSVLHSVYTDPVFLLRKRNVAFSLHFSRCFGRRDGHIRCGSQEKREMIGRERKPRCALPFFLDKSIFLCYYIVVTQTEYQKQVGISLSRGRNTLFLSILASLNL